MQGSFKKEDVELLLKDITGMVEPLPTKEREKRIQSGVHYSEMLPLEYQPSERYLRIYEKALKMYKTTIANAVATVSEKIYKRLGNDIIIVSLARAGTPIGIVIKRFLENQLGVNCKHYSISIIRDKGIDKNAINYIINHHAIDTIQFVDGWIGKGVILRELKEALSEFEGLSPELAVLSDPANLTELCGTHEDILIPSSCLNCTVCGLISRTLYRKDIIGASDYHGAAYYEQLMEEDRTYEFIDTICGEFKNAQVDKIELGTEKGIDFVKTIANEYQIQNLNLIKPGIGETTRVLLRRIPWRVLVDTVYADSEELMSVVQLAYEKSVPIEYRPLRNYKCIGIIKNLEET